MSKPPPSDEMRLVIDQVRAELIHLYHEAMAFNGVNRGRRYRVHSRVAESLAHNTPETLHAILNEDER